MAEPVFHRHTLDASSHADITVCHNGLMVHAMVMARDNPTPWTYDPDNHGVVSNWTNRPRQNNEMLLHEVAAFTDSGAGRGKLYYDIPLSEDKFYRKIDKRRTVDPVKLSRRMMREDFTRLQGWCRGEWWYVEINVQVYSQDDMGPRTLGSQGMGPIASDDVSAINAAVERCAQDALAEAYQRVWSKFSGDSGAETSQFQR